MVYLGLPIKNGWIFHGYVSHNQMVPKMAPKPSIHQVQVGQSVPEPEKVGHVGHVGHGEARGL